jgi:hypothetical protein
VHEDRGVCRRIVACVRIEAGVMIGVAQRDSKRRNNATQRDEQRDRVEEQRDRIEETQVVKRASRDPCS